MTKKLIKMIALFLMSSVLCSSLPVFAADFRTQTLSSRVNLDNSAVQIIFSQSADHFSLVTSNQEKLENLINHILSKKDRDSDTSEGLDFDLYFQQYLAKYSRLALNASEKVQEIIREKNGNSIEAVIADSELDKARNNLAQANKRILSLRSLLLTNPLSQVFVAIPGGAKSELSNSQRFALDIISEEIGEYPELVYKPENIFFVPKNSWLREIFRFNEAGEIFRLSRTSHEYMIFIDDSIQEDVEVFHVLLHELIHQKFTDSSYVVLDNSLSAANFYNIVEEVEVERQASRLMKKLTRKNLRLQDAVARYLKLGKININNIPGLYYKKQIRPEDVAAYIYPAYVEEKIFLRQFRKTLGKETQKELKNFLDTGDYSGLEQKMGSAEWKQFLFCVTLFKKTRYESVHRGALLYIFQEVFRLSEKRGLFMSLQKLVEVYELIAFFSPKIFVSDYPQIETDPDVFRTAKEWAGLQYLRDWLLDRRGSNHQEYFEYLVKEIKSMNDLQESAKEFQLEVQLFQKFPIEKEEIITRFSQSVKLLELISYSI
jgi:flagellar hook-basal body complex protein FliE